MRARDADSLTVGFLDFLVKDKAELRRGTGYSERARDSDVLVKVSSA
jgi:hypothetical protein